MNTHHSFQNIKFQLHVLSCVHIKLLTRIISNIRKIAKAAPKARSRNFGWKK